MDNIGNLVQVLRALSKLTGLYFVWKTSERQWLPRLCREQRYHCCDFCTAVKQSSPAAMLACNRHHAEAAFVMALQKREPFLLNCHAGITELVVPILAGNCRAAIFAGPFHSPSGLPEGAKQFEKEYRKLPVHWGSEIGEVRDLLTTLLNVFDPQSWPRQDLQLLPLQDFSVSDSRICQALQFLRQNFQRKISEEYLAQTLSLSPSRLRHLFREQVGISLQDYLQRLRVDEARHMVEMTELPIGVIAVECGMSDQSRLALLFRRYYKESPTSLRAKSFALSEKLLNSAWLPALSHRSEKADNP